MQKSKQASLHSQQSLVFRDPSRHKFVLAGRRGGKTVLLREKLLERVSQCPPKGEVFYIGPTLQDAADIMWEPILDRLDELKWRYNPLISKRRFEFSRGRKLYIIGAEKIRRIRGHSVFFAALDEVAFYGTPLKTIWKAVRPALSDLKGGSMVTTTPNGKGTDAYDFYLESLKQEDWKYFYWRTIDNPWIDSSEVESARRELDERSFRQEYEASWQSFEGLAYYNFDEVLHLRRSEGLNPNLPIDLLFDFNVNPTTLLVAQNPDSLAQIKKEYSRSDSSTLSTIKVFCEDFRNHKTNYRFRIMGDAAGNNRHSTTGYSDYHYIKEVLSKEGFQFEVCVPASNPAIIDRVAHVNSWLKNYYGESRIEIDPGCKDLIRDLSSQELEGRHPSSKNNLGHKADAFGYYINWIHLTTGRKKQGTVFL